MTDQFSDHADTCRVHDMQPCDCKTIPGPQPPGWAVQAVNKIGALAFLIGTEQDRDDIALIIAEAGPISMAMALLSDVADRSGEIAPFPEFFKRYFLLTSEHMVLTEEGWIPAECNTREHTGVDPMEVLDEVNARGAATLANGAP